jgi:signal peptidase I
VEVAVIDGMIATEVREDLVETAHRMKDVLLLLLVLVLLGGEATFFYRNPLHIPGDFLPDRAIGLELCHELSASMEPTVHDGQHVIVSAWAYWGSEPQVGDVVAFVYPDDPSTADLKRIIAVGGSTIEIEQGQVYVDGKRISEPYVQSSSKNMYRSLTKRRIPKNSFFVMGDNRDGSEDSRNYGPISRGRILGKLWL